MLSKCEKVSKCEFRITSGHTRVKYWEDIALLMFRRSCVVRRMEGLDESIQNICFEDLADVNLSDPERRETASPDEEAVQDTDILLKTPGTPRKGQGLTFHHGKHDLTPESKLSAQVTAKRLAKHDQPANLSSKQCSDRRTKLIEEIENVMAYSEDPEAFVEQKTIMDLLDLTEKDKNLLTRSITTAFPHCLKKTICTNNKKEVVYTNVCIKPTSLPSSSRIVKELFEGSDEISELQKQMAIVEELLLKEWDCLTEELGAGNIDKARLIAVKYKTRLEQFVNFKTVLVKLYEDKLEKLQEIHLEEQISDVQKNQILHEMRELQSLCCLGLKSDGDIECFINERVFPKLLEDIEEKCPLIFSILQTLLVADVRKRVHKTPEHKLKCGVNALALLLSVRNQKFSNDVRLLFGLLCISYGAGKQFVNMLNAIGLSPHWDTITNFLDSRLDQLKATLSEKCIDSTPVILLMDNINMYRGKKRHDRLLKDIGPKMWNFTGRAAVIPDLSDIKDMLACKENMTEPQIDMTNLQPKDILLDSMPKQKLLWENWCDRYYIDLLEKSLNDMPAPPKPLEKMSEPEVHTWLGNISIEEGSKKKYSIQVPSIEQFVTNMQCTDKTDVINLSLSLEDNSTLTGTAAILDNFAEEFGIYHEKGNEYIEFDKTKKEFDIKSARERYFFMKSLQLHHMQMKELEKQLCSSEKEIDLINLETEDVSGESDEDESDSDSHSSSSSSRSRSAHEDADAKFSTLYKWLISVTQQAIDSSDGSNLEKMIQDCKKKQKEINNTKDRYGRTVFHAAIEEKRYTLVKLLLSCGVNPNEKEGCGATPLTLAVLKLDVALCKLLVDNFAEYQGEMYGSFPSPLDMAMAMEAHAIVNLFQSNTTNMQCPLPFLIQNDRCEVVKTEAEPPVDEQMSNSDSDDNCSHFTYKRSECRDFPTAVVGDVGTCKNNRGVRNRDSSKYGWFTEVPGDMHAKGYLCEAAFKAHGSGGLHKILNVVMKRPKLTKEAFKKRKFQDQNLNRIKEGVRDASQSYGMAAVLEFKRSSSFPSSDELKRSLQRFGNHNEVLLRKFKEWLKESAEKDQSHAYHQQLFTLFGPLLALFIVAGKYGDGNLREIVWVILLPIFAQLGFRNYWTEAFVHVVNFSALWPLAFRKLIRSNSTVNLSGRVGHNLDLDEYVETYIVRPLKIYVTGHTSVQMCKRLMGNLNLFGLTRATYSNKEAFDYHPTSRHKEQSSFPDQLKGMWFCVKNKFFEVSSGKIPYQFPIEGSSAVPKAVPKLVIAVKERGQKKVEEKFEEKLHDCFPSFRKFSFEKVVLDATIVNTDK